MKSMFLALALTIAAAPVAMAEDAAPAAPAATEATVAGWVAPEGHREGAHFRRGEQIPKIYREESNYVDVSSVDLKPAGSRNVWVRVESDAYLISRNTGLIETVVRDVFK